MDDDYMKPGGSTARSRKTKKRAAKKRAAKKYGRTSTRRTHRGHVQKK